MSVNVAIYVRLSNEDRNKLFKGDDSESIQNQKSMLTAYCKERNWDIFDIYVDDGFSGIDKTRPDFNRMLADCEKGRVNLVLCKSQSRFSRDSTIIEMYLHDKFVEWGIRFKSIVDNVDTYDEANKKSRQINALVNEWYVEETSKNIRKVFENKQKQGKFTGSFAPYGYKLDPDIKNHLIIDPIAAEIVKMVFDMYVQGNGYRNIVKELNSKGIPSPTLYKQLNGSKFHNHNLQGSSSFGLWTVSTIYTMIRNEVYTGTLAQGKSHRVSYKNHKQKKVNRDEWYIVENTHEPIINKDIWDKTQERLNSRKRVDKITQTLSPLSGKVKCALCGKPMKRNVYYNTKRTKLYYGLQCATYKTGAMNCVNEKSISGLQLEKFLVQQINEHIKEFCCTDSITLCNTYQQKIEVLKNNLVLINEQILTNENKLEKIYDDYLSEVITVEQYKIFSKKYTDIITDLKSDSEKIQTQIKQLEKNKASTLDKKNTIKKYTNIEKLSHEIVNVFIDTVLIGVCDENNNREITINWKI